MTGKVALCVDGFSSRNPELIGLEGESLDSQDWLGVFSSGHDARLGIAEAGAYSEAWVVSCEDVEPINLAAALKADSPDLRVCLVTPDACGSLRSRAHNALIDEVLDRAELPRRYAEAKRRSLGVFEQSDSDIQQLQASVPALAPMPVPVPEVIEHEERVAKPKVAQLLRLQPRSEPLAVQSASRAFVLPVVSGSGGAGKSSVSALGALIAQRMGHRTLLLDYDLQFGDADMIMGVENPLRVDVAMAHPDQLERELSRDDGPILLAAPARLESAEEVVRGLPALLDQLADSFDVIVANTGAAWAEQHAALLERSSAALFLIDQRASSVRACQHALELCARCGIASGPFQFALNRCVKGAPLTSADVSCALQGAPVFELKEGGRDVEDYLSGGGAIELIDARNDFARSLEHVMAQLLPGEVNLPAERPARRRKRRRK